MDVEGSKPLNNNAEPFNNMLLFPLNLMVSSDYDNHNTDKPYQ